MKASDIQVGGQHYKILAIQPSEFIQRNKLNWCEGNVVKYVSRHREKNGRQDIEKAIHYLNLLLEWEYPQALDPKKYPPHLRELIIEKEEYIVGGYVAPGSSSTPTDARS